MGDALDRAPTYQALAWDTAFFGFPIGRVDLDGLAPESVLAMEDDARAAGIHCLYGSLDPAARESTVLAQALGYRFVEAATLFSLRTTEPVIPAPPGCSIRLGTPDDLATLEPVIASLAAWSRFAVDPRFGLEAARRMQFAIVERAARCEDDERALVVAEDSGGIVAFITRCAVPEPVVDTVGTTARGSGAARWLIEHTRQWAGDRTLYGGPIAARNVDALRYVGHCGYRVSSVRYLYHRWLDEMR